MTDEKEDIEYHTAILDELITILPSDDDEFLKFEETKRQLKTINEVWERQKEMLQDCIIAFTAEKDEQEQIIKLSEKQEGENQKHKELQQKLENHKQNKGSVEQQIKELIDEEKKCEEEKDKLEREKERVENSTTKVLPHHRSEVQLYHTITGIRWQYDCPSEEVKGLIASKQKRVDTFELNKQQNSQFFIANHLWDLIERTHQK